MQVPEVIANPLLLAAVLLALSQSGWGEGRIGGQVVNVTQGGAPEAEAEVFLQAKIDGDFVGIARARSDSGGRFLFEGLPVDQGWVFLAGASRDGIHYPGPRISLSANRPDAQLLLKVHDSAAGPNPLVIRDYDIVLVPEPGALRVTETLLIENPLPVTYVGPAVSDATEPVTLELGISPEFERVTFHKEFYGRRFSMRDGRLVTGIPWTPGQRELKFTYVLRSDGKFRLWTRPLDLPCRSVRLTVLTDTPDKVSSNLGTASRTRDGAVTFASDSRLLAAGSTIKVELSGLPVSVMAYARWFALAVLALAIVGSCVALAYRKHAAESQGRGMQRGPHLRKARART
jgi:hypothetical protein